MPDPPPSIAAAYPDRVHGIVREFGACYHWAAASARPCFKEKGDDCTMPVVGVFFEIFQNEWLEFRNREDDYDLLEVAPSLPLPEGLDPDGFFFAWGDLTATGEPPTCGYVWNKRYGTSVISQAYWDYIIGGLMSWDGQLLDNGRYTWDLVTELELRDEMAFKVHQMPSLPLVERRQLAVDFVKSTKHSNLPWVDDRTCPFTGDSIVTPLANLSEEVLATGPTADAVGTVSPLFSKEFHEYVDSILIEGGWEYGAQNGMHERTVPCSEANSYEIQRSDWTRNPYYDDLVAFSTAVESEENYL